MIGQRIKHPQGSLHDNLTLDIHNLKEQILASLTTINKHEYDQDAWSVPLDNLQWLNPQNWFSSTKRGLIGLSIVLLTSLVFLIIV